jgi:hypothetical protein
MKKIICLAGSGGKGKDSFVEACEGILQVMNVDSVFKVKRALEDYFDCNRYDKSEKARKFMATVTSAWDEFNDGRYEYLKGEINWFETHNTTDELMFIHIREPWLIDRLKNDFGAIPVILKNPNVPDVKTNAADAGVYDYVYDYEIDNSGSLLDLMAESTKFIAWLKSMDN